MVGLGVDAAYVQDVAIDLNAELLQKATRHGAGRYPRGALPGAGSFQYVPGIRLLVLGGPGCIGMAGAQLGDWLKPHLRGLNVHHILPRDAVRAGARGPVAVLYPHGYGAANGEAVAYAGQDIRVVTLYLHSPAAAVAHLPSGHVPGDVLLAQGYARGQPFYHNGESLAVGLTGCKKPEHLFFPLLLSLPPD